MIARLLQKQKKAIEELTNTLRQEFNIPTNAIISHAEATQEGRGQEGVEIAQIAREATQQPRVNIPTTTTTTERPPLVATQTYRPDDVIPGGIVGDFGTPPRVNIPTTTERPPVVTNQTVTPNNVVPGGIVGDVAFEAPGNI